MDQQLSISGLPNAPAFTDSMDRFGLGMDEKAQAVLNRHMKLKEYKRTWLPTWQLIGEFVMTRKQDFTQQVMPGALLTGRIFDSTAPTANRFLASSLIGALYPNGGQTFRVQHPRSMPKDVADSKDVKEWYSAITDAVGAALDNPTSGFLTSLEEYMVDQGAFGTSAIIVEENRDKNGVLDSDCPCKFVSLDAKQLSIDEGADGSVDTVYIERRLTVKKVVEKYGIDNVSDATRQRYIQGELDERVMVLHAIEPRQDTLGGFGARGMPIASIHLEIDARHILQESGFPERTIFVTRFWKSMDEIYGRSPATEAMSDIIEINTTREATIVATEKMLDPPLLLKSDGSAGGGTLNTSASALNVRIVSGRMADHGPFVEQLVTVGNIEPTYKRLEIIQENIEAAFFKDRLTDLNNDHRQTLGEANIRNDLRGQSLGSVYSRQIVELFYPLVMRVIHIMMNGGLLGLPANDPQVQRQMAMGITPLIIPDAIMNLIKAGKDSYHLLFISPAARTMRQEELKGILQTMQWVTEGAQIMPDLLDNFDTDMLASEVTYLSGAPSSILRSAEDKAEYRKQKAAAQQVNQQMGAAHVGGETARAYGQAALAAAKAGIPPQAMLPQQQQAQ